MARCPAHAPEWLTRRENRVLSIIGRQHDKTSRTGKRAIQLAGSAVEGSFGLDLVFLFLSSFPAMAAWSLNRYHKPSPDKCVEHSAPPPPPLQSEVNAAGKDSGDRQRTRRSKWLVLNPGMLQSRGSEWLVLNLDQSRSRGSKWPVLAAPAADICPPSPG